jgi:hypothetical protein
MEARRVELDCRLRALGIRTSSAPSRRRVRSAAAAAARVTARPAAELHEPPWMRLAAEQAHKRGRFIRFYSTPLEVH